ncbi:diphosphomevalonate decarboxylase [Candidatus Woesebacteria bacterium]|nr:diphosphomevalonate decarboxylase [Candidatus Woesebacteria bacterium]MCD8507685.1 diphosphomevalonate decarboxylase [Candidatus Woesebacteria bacterium]MCD8526732.1 diphosphomevalonate decarboxylase [Candidatus Woesebacteria bacterium]
MKATAEAPANIAFIKYWGNADANLRLPHHNTISMNLSGAKTTTTVEFVSSLDADEVFLGGSKVDGTGAERVSKVLDHIRKISGNKQRARVTTHNSFPTAAGIASSASGFAALAVAAASAAGLSLTEQELSTVARLGSGSATRSIPDGFVEWHAGSSHETSFAESLYAPEYWDIVDIITVVDADQKKVSSTLGHSLADTSLLYPARLASMKEKVESVKRALAEKDFPRFGELIEEESLNLHAIMMTSRPSVLYWSPATVRVLQALREWRQEGLLAYSTMDAGANVHVITRGEDETAVTQRLQALKGVEKTILGKPAAGAHLVK